MIVVTVSDGDVPGGLHDVHHNVVVIVTTTVAVADAVEKDLSNVTSCYNSVLYESMFDFPLTFLRFSYVVVVVVIVSLLVAGLPKQRCPFRGCL